MHRYKPIPTILTSALKEAITKAADLGLDSNYIQDVKDLEMALTWHQQATNLDILDFSGLADEIPDVFVAWQAIKDYLGA